jgi:hypothetical protein
MPIGTAADGKSSACVNQLNAQLQILDARVKQAEKQVAVLGKGLAEVAGGVTTPAGPIGAGFKAMAAAQGQAFADAYNGVLNSLPTSLTDAMMGMLIQMALKQLGSVSLAVTEMANALASLNTQFDVAVNALAVLDPLNPANFAQIAALNAQIDGILHAFGSAQAVSTAITNISQCKSNSLMIS